MPRRYKVELSALYSPEEAILTVKFTASNNSSSMTLNAHPHQFALIHMALNWPELIDAAIKKARSEFRRLGRPPDSEDQLPSGRSSPPISYRADFELVALRWLWDRIDGDVSPGFFPAER